MWLIRMKIIPRINFSKHRTADGQIALISPASTLYNLAEIYARLKFPGSNRTERQPGSLRINVDATEMIVATHKRSWNCLGAFL